MRRTGRILVATAAAAVLVFAVVYATSGGPSKVAGKPVRALGAGGDADADLVVGSGGAPAVPLAGTTAMPHRSGPLAKVTNRPPTTVPWVKRELDMEAEEAAAGEENEGDKPVFERSADLGQADAVLQTDRGSAQFPAPSLSFKGLGANANPFQLVPPDTNGDVGNGYYLQMVNVAFAVYDADTGAKLAGPIFMSSLFDVGTQRLCATHDDGDPIVVYDEYANRFVISQFGLNFNKAKFAECVAVSATSDPTGSWNAYQFDYPKANLLNDYPKFGVWPSANNNAYFASFNQFRCSTSKCDFAWRGAGAIAYDRAAMIAGNPADQVYFDLYGVDPNLGGQLPSDADGPTPPGAGTPNYFVQMDADEFGYPDDALEVWEFDVDWGTPANSTFTAQTTSLTTADFSPWICGAGKTYCIPQKGTTNKLDALNDRVMWRLQYRNMGGGDERMVVNQSVRASGGQSGLRWYELNDSGSGWGIANQGTYAPDTAKSRWMGSAAMDSAGNIAIGYSLSSGKIFPSIGVVGRTAGAPANTLDLGERKVFTGLGSEDGNYGRWGDYSAMTVAEDGCTFYYTTQYYKKTGQWKWATQVLRFTIPGC
ncbi:MAG TPA: hypothetical protein VIG53_06460 [Actinomycetota bacterium]